MKTEKQIDKEIKSMEETIAVMRDFTRDMSDLSDITQLEAEARGGVRALKWVKQK